MKIYISYNFEDRTSVLYLTQKLKQKGFDVWIYSEKLIAGDPVFKKIENELKISTKIVVCIGKSGLNGLQSSEIKLILKIKKQNKKIFLLPVLLPGSDESFIPGDLKNIPFIDFRNTFENIIEMENLYKVLSGEDIALPQNLTSKAQVNFKKPKNKRAVSVALYYEDEIFIIKRSENQKSGGGLWQLPGGKINKGETPIRTAMREIKEEVGVLIDEKMLVYVTELVDSWIINSSDDYITMVIYTYKVSSKHHSLANEFQTGKWVKLSELFNDDETIYFGSTTRYLRILRRYFLLYLPLKDISDILFKKSTNINLPIKLKNSSKNVSQTIYSFLSLFGFLDDRNNFIPSSTLSANLIKVLAEWSLTESTVFEAEGNNNWQKDAQINWDIEQIEKFREGLFDKHKNLLGLLSYRLPKALSKRNVGDILLTAKNPKIQKKYLLIRWDLLASKFQIPAKGLEECNSENSSLDTAKFIVGERLNVKLINKFNYRYFNSIETSHVGAGSLEDGPILRNYNIVIFDLTPIQNFNDDIIETLNQVNSDTIKIINQGSILNDKIKRTLNFYVWVDIDYLNLRRKAIQGKKLQGYDEIITEFGINYFNNDRVSVVLNSKNKIPVISLDKTINSHQLDIVIKKTM